MAVKYTKQYGNTSEYLYDHAKATDLFDEELYTTLNANNLGDEYASAVIVAKDNPSKKFNKGVYSMLSPTDKYGYFMTTQFGDEESDDYKTNMAYFQQRYEEAQAKQAYENLNWLGRTGVTVGGMVGTALNEVVGILEGLIDATAMLGGESAMDFVAKDITGYHANKKALDDMYTAVDKSAFLKGVQDVASGIVRMSPMIAGYALAGYTGGASVYVGNAIYYASMAGNTAEQTIKANPDIGYWRVLGYTAASTALEYGIEKISGKIGGSLFGGTGASAIWWKQLGIDFASEGFEEMASELFDSILYRTIVDPDAPIASIEDILYAGLIGAITGAIISGGNIASTSRLMLDENGNFVPVKEAKSSLKTGEKLNKKKFLTKGQSYTIQALNKQWAENPYVSEVTKLQTKYKNESLNDIQKNHAEEYADAVEQDTKMQKFYAKQMSQLVKVLQTIGQEKFIKASEVLNYTYEQAAKLQDNYENKTDAYSVRSKEAQALFEAKNPGVSFTIPEELSHLERTLMNELKKYGFDAFFGVVGSKDGKPVKEIQTTGNNVFIDKETMRSRSLESIMTEVIKQELVNNLMTDLQTISPKEYGELLKIINQTPNTEYKNLTNEQKQAIAGMLLFDEFTVDAVFKQDKKSFFKIYSWIKKKITENRAAKNKTDKNKKQFRELLLVRERYEEISFAVLGNMEDAEELRKKLGGMSDERFEQLLRSRLTPTALNEYYVLVNDDNNFDTVNKEKMLLEIMTNRIDTDLTIALDWSKIDNPTYYVSAFVDGLKDKYPAMSFSDALWNYIFDKYGIAMSIENQTFYTGVDLAELLNDEIRSELIDASISNDPTQLKEITNVNQLFGEDFTKRFNDINAEIIWQENITSSTNASTIKQSNGEIKIVMRLGQNLGNVDSVLLHEVAHVLALKQGLPFGTSVNLMKETLTQNASESMIKGLAELMLTEEARTTLSQQEIIEQLAYRMYILSKGEIYASANTKAYAEFKDGFVVTDTIVFGTGRYSRVNGMPTMFKLATPNIEAKQEYVDNAGGQFAKFLDEQGIFDLKAAGFSDSAIRLIGNSKEGALWQLFVTDPELEKVDGVLVEKKNHVNGVGTEKANKILISFLKPNNKYITTFKKAKIAAERLPYAPTYVALSKKYNKQHEKNTPHSPEHVVELVNNPKYAERAVEDEFFKKGTTTTAVGLFERTQTSIDSWEYNHPSNSAVIIDVIDMDYDFSETKTKEIFKDLKQGLDSSKENLFVSGTTTTTDGEFVERADISTTDQIETPDSMIESITEDADSDLAGFSVKDLQTMSVEKLKTTLNEWIETKGKTSTETFSISKRLEKPMAKSRLTQLLGEEKYNALYDAFRPFKKSDMKKRITTRKNKLAKFDNLTKEQQDLLNEDVSNYTPNDFADYEDALNSAISDAEQRAKKQKAKEVNAQKRKLNEQTNLTDKQKDLLDTDTTQYTSEQYDALKQELQIETLKASEQTQQTSEKAKELAEKKKAKKDKKIRDTIEKALNIDSEEDPINYDLAKQQEPDKKTITLTKEVVEKAERLKSMMPSDLMLSEYQGDFTKDPKWVSSAKKTVNQNKDFFEKLTSDDVKNMRVWLSIQLDDDIAASADVLLQSYMYDNRYSQFNDIAEWIKKANKTLGSKSGAFLGKLSATYGKKSIKALITQVGVEKQVEIEIPDTIVEQGIEAVTGEQLSKESFTERIDNELRALIEKREVATDPYEKFELKQEILQKQELLEALQDNDSAAALDSLVDVLESTDTNQTENQEKITALYDAIVDYVLTHTTVDSTNQPVFSKNKTILTKSSAEKVSSFFAGLNSFRYLCMLSSPSTWARNWISNTGVGVQSVVEDSVTRGFENTKWLSEDSQVRFTGDYDKEFSNYIDEKYLPEIKKRTEGDKYTTSEFDKLKNQYAKAQDPLNKSKLLKKIKQFEEKMLNDQPWTQRKTLKNLKNMLAGSQPQIYSQCYDTLSTLYGENKTSDELFEKINKTNPKIAEEFKQATSGNILATVRLGERLQIPLLSLNQQEENSIFNMAVYRANKLFFKVDNAINKAVTSLRKSKTIGGKAAAAFIIGITPFIRNAVNTTMYTIDRSPIGLVKGVFKLMQTKTAYRNDMVYNIEQYYKSVYVKSKTQELGNKFKFKNAEFEAWAKTNVPADVLSAIQNKHQYKELHAIYDAMVADGKIPPHAIGANNVFMRALAMEQLSQGIVGTSTMILGVVLGALLGVFEYDDDDDYLGAMIKIGDFKLPLNELSPYSTLFAVGAMLSSGKVDDNLGAAFEVFVDSSIFSTMDSALKYSDSFKDFIGNQFTNTVAQFQPAVTKRLTKAIYNTKKDKSGDFATRFLKTLGSNSLVFNWLVPNKINPYTGKPETYYESGWFERIFNTISPVGYRYDVKSDLQREAERLGATTSGLSGTFEINDEPRKLSSSEKETYAKYRADYIRDRYEDIVAGREKVTVKQKDGSYVTTTYNKLTDKQKASVLNNLYSSASTNTKIKWWIDNGNIYKTSNKDEYERLKKLFNSSKIKYEKGYKKSKFVEV